MTKSAGDRSQSRQLLKLVSSRIIMGNFKSTYGTKKNLSEFTHDHLANERTYLAWIRTAISLTAFAY
ncbi:MAG: DUF202 domain-containing protein [Oscillatoriales cyanobacterium SM2_2_1]|nr:DUF202 domain-containing protein [Oscillatoriales cyanobacterium SM2_2_1]